MRVVGYVRVSTERQAEEGLGLEVQRRALRRWAKDGGHRLVSIEADEGVSGAKEAADRPGLAAALEAVESRRAEGLVVARLDRLSRKLTVQEAALAQVWKHGGQVFTVDAGEVDQDDPDDPMRTAMRQMIGVFAELERGMIGARLRAGRRLKAEQGGYAYGAPAFGKRAEGGELVGDAAEQRALRRILELRRAGASYRAIVAALDAEGHRPKRARRWHPQVVRDIVERELGAGAKGAA